MNLPIRMRIILNIKHNYAIRLKFRDNYLTCLTNLVLEAKAGTCSTVKENLLLYCRTLLTFLAVVIIVVLFL